MRKIVLASNNAGKLAKFNTLLGTFGLDATPQGALGIPEAEEPYATFVENTLTKARHASRTSDLPVLVDNSGIHVHALGDAPGVYSARYAQLVDEPKSGATNNARFVHELVGKADRGAHHVCVLVYVRHADDPQPIIAEGNWFGEVIDTPRGDGDFGHDPHFLLPNLGKTAAELTKAEKNSVGHRAQALAQLVERLRASENA